MIIIHLNKTLICVLGKVFLTYSMLLASAMSIAEPNLQSVSNIDGVTIFEDHENPTKYYYLKSSKRLGVRDQQPDFTYAVNRYIGKKITGDESAFWVRGVIKFSTEAYFSSKDLSAITLALRERVGRPVTVVAAPMRDSFNKLVYATIAPIESKHFTGEILGGQSSQEQVETAGDSGQRLFGARRQRFTIGLSGNDANLFWENFERNNLTLSLGYGWTIPGVIKNQNDEWVASSYQVNDSLPIDISFDQHPELFSKNELWQRLSFAHSGIKVMCYDFINVETSNLYYVNVEIRFNTLRGQSYSEQVKFRADTDDYERDVSFALANDLDDGYEYRVRRMTNEGELSLTDWIKADSAWLDVSMSAAELNDIITSDNEDTEL